MVNYFSRKIFAKSIATKEAKKVDDFIRETDETFLFNRLICKNSKEFSSSL